MDTGGKIRTGKLLEKLKDVFHVTLISNFEEEKDKSYSREIQSLCTEFHSVSWKEVKKYSVKFYLKLLLNMFSPYPVTVLNDYSRKLEEKVLSVLVTGKFDLLICDFLQSALNFRNVTGCPIILFQHNVESAIARRHFERAGGLAHKLFWWLQWRKMDRYEKEQCRKFDAVIAVSENDKETFEKKYDATKAFSIPTGIDIEYFTPASSAIEEGSLVFAGSMDWLPNEDAILYFSERIFPLIKDQVPNATLTVVGRNPSNHLTKVIGDCAGIQLTGWVDDVRPIIGRHEIYVIPLRIGGGTRIKAYEALAMGKAVVSTSIGVEGLPLQQGEHVVIADDVTEFAQAVVRLLKYSDERRELERRGREYVEKNCSWEKVSHSFAGICLEVADS